MITFLPFKLKKEREEIIPSPASKSKEDENLEDYEEVKDIPENIQQDLQIKPVKWIDEVLQIALQYAPEPLSDAAPEIVAKDESREAESKERISTH